MLILREPHRKLEITRGAEGWRDFLEDPPRHWKNNQAARRLAEMWEGSAPLAPRVVRTAWCDTPFEEFEPTIAIPAYEVEMPGGWPPARNDLLIVGPIGDDLGLIMVQGKVSDTLGPHIDEVLQLPMPGKLRRIGFLKDVLELPDPLPESTCYNLLDRAASPLLEARRLRARYAAMIVTAYGALDLCLEEYGAFARLCGVSGDPDRLERLPAHDNPELWIGWIQADSDGSERLAGTPRADTDVP
jgi:hypothetical protein